MSVPIPAAMSRAAEAVLPALEQAARRTGADFSALFHTARLESGFNPAVRARTSSATGLFQFIDATWLNTLARHGARHGIAPTSRAEALALRTNPQVAALMAAEHMADNATRIEQATGRKPGATELYLAHFLGVGGATKFLGALDRNPETPGIQLFPAAARANRAIFFDRSGEPRSLAGIRDLFARKLGMMPAPAASQAQNRGLSTQLAAAIAAGTVVPEAGAATGTTVPPVVALAAPLGASGLAAAPPPNPRLAAQAARLLLAELGG